MALRSVFDRLNSLPKLAQIDVTLRSEWILPDPWNRTWQGEALAEQPMVGIAFMSLDSRMFWLKSVHISNSVAIRLVVHPSAVPHYFQLMCFLGSYTANHDTMTMLNDNDDLPEIPHSQTVQTGHLLTIASFESTPKVDLHLLFLARQDVTVARGNIWSLKKPLRAGLTSPLLEVFSHGREGNFAF